MNKGWEDPRIKPLKLPRILDLSRFIRSNVEVKLDGCGPIEGKLIHIEKNVFLKVGKSLVLVRGDAVYSIGIKGDV